MTRRAGDPPRRPAAGPAAATERASITAFVAVLAVALVALIGLVVDGGAALAATRSATDVAEQAARAGAGALDVGALHAGQVLVDPGAAEQAARSYLAAAGMPGNVTVSHNRVTVAISFEEPTTLLGIIGISHIHVSATASAVDVHGVVRQD